MGFVQRKLVQLVLAVVSYPRTTLAICAVVLIASVAGAWFHLSLSTDENALLTPDLPFFKDYLRFDAKFPENESFVVILEPKDYSHPPLASRWIALADAIKAKLTDPNSEVHKDIDRVDTHAPLQALGRQAAMFGDWDSVKDGSAGMQKFLPLLKILGEKPGLESVMLGSNVTQRFFSALANGPANDESNTFALLVARTLSSALQTPPDNWQYGPDTPNLTELQPEAATDPELFGYNMIPDETKRNDLQHKNEKILVINIYENRDYESLADVSEPLQRMRTAVADAAKNFPEFTAGITGRPALEADEMRTSDQDTTFAEILGLSLVFVVLWIFLRNLWLVIVAEVGLGVGIGWTFGWATLAVGRLNLLSLVFIIALIGIGMDYLIQIITRYRHESKRYHRPKAIFARVFRYVSPPISTACAGAAGAFLVSKFTNFAGAGELGLIAGGGLLLCLASGYTFLPAVLTLFPPRIKKIPAEKRFVDVNSKARITPRRLAIPILWIILSVGGLYLALPPKFDPDLIKLQAQGLESVRLVHKLPTWYAAIMSDNLDTLRAAQEKILAARPGESTTILRTESLLDAIDHQQWMAQHNANLSSIQWSDPPAPTAADLPAIASAAQKLLSNWSTQKDAPNLTALKSAIQSLTTQLTNKSQQQQNLARLTLWQKSFLTELHSRAEQLIPPPLDISLLPKEVRDHFVSFIPDIAQPRSQRTPSETQQSSAQPTYALYVYPKEDLWSGDKLHAFVDELESRLADHPANLTVTGIAVQLYHSTQEIRRAFLLSSLYALALIFLLVLLDLRNIPQTLLAISVLAFGLPMLLLMMYLWRFAGEPFGIPGSWNFANFFGLPILIGAGHEYGVFMVHRYRETLHDPRRLWAKWDVADRALLLCAIVTSFSFGFLTLAHHRGLASLGWVMAVGSACIYLATILVLRPILIWRLTQREKRTRP